jgi:hypothetical protein
MPELRVALAGGIGSAAISGGSGKAPGLWAGQPDNAKPDCPPWSCAGAFTLDVAWKTRPILKAAPSAWPDRPTLQDVDH